MEGQSKSNQGPVGGNPGGIVIIAERPKAPKGFAYVLKTSIFEAALTESGVEIATHLVYWTPRRGGSVLQAFFWMPNERVPHRRLYVRAGSVAADQRSVALEQLQDRGLPRFVHWLRALHEQPDASPALHMKPHFDAAFLDGQLSVRCQPAP